MSGRRRLARLNEQLKRELSELIRTKVRDPRVGLVTVTAVEVAADLGSARVHVRVLGEQGEAAEALEGLRAAAPFLRGVLGRTLELRRIPELRFQEDHSLEHARRIEEILSDVLPEEPPAEQEGAGAAGDAGAEEGGPVEAEGDADEERDA